MENSAPYNLGAKDKAAGGGVEKKISMFRQSEVKKKTQQIWAKLDCRNRNYKDEMFKLSFISHHSSDLHIWSHIKETTAMLF